MSHEIESIAFEGPITPYRGHKIRASNLKPPRQADAFVELLRDGEVVRSFYWPAYKVYNLQAHFKEIVDSELAGTDAGYRQAAWNGIGPV